MFPCKSSDLKCWISRGCFFFPEYEFSNLSNWKNLCAMSRQVLDVMLYSCRISCMTSCFLGSRIWKGCFQNFNKDQHQTIFAGHFGDLNYFGNVNVSLSFCGFYVYTHILFLWNEPSLTGQLVNIDCGDISCILSWYYVCVCVCHFSDPEKNACQHQLWVSYGQQPLCHFSDPGNHATHHWKKKHLRWHMVLSSSMCQISRCNFQFSMCKVETFHEFSWPWLYMKTTANPWLPCWTVICPFCQVLFVQSQSIQIM